MLEPVLAGIFAWICLSEKLSAVQLAGGAVVLVGIYLADKAKNSI
jgi:drug/metabolite transporter (DMT)-like permease